MQEIIRDGVTQLNKLPPSSDPRLRTVCVLAARSGYNAALAACPGVLCHGTKAVSRPGVLTGVVPPLSKSDWICLSPKQTGSALLQSTHREGFSHPTGCNHCPCIPGPLPRLPLLLSFPCSAGRALGEAAGAHTHPIRAFPIAGRDSGPGTQGTAVSRGALPGVSGPGCLMQR